MINVTCDISSSFDSIAKNTRHIGVTFTDVRINRIEAYDSYVIVDHSLNPTFYDIIVSNDDLYEVVSEFDDIYNDVRSYPAFQLPGKDVKSVWTNRIYIDFDERYYYKTIKSAQFLLFKYKDYNFGGTGSIAIGKSGNNPVFYSDTASLFDDEGDTMILTLNDQGLQYFNSDEFEYFELSSVYRFSEVPEPFETFDRIGTTAGGIFKYVMIHYGDEEIRRVTCDITSSISQISDLTIIEPVIVLTSCSITSSISQISDLTIIEPGIVLTSCSITSSFDTSGNVHQILYSSSSLTSSFDTSGNVHQILYSSSSLTSSFYNIANVISSVNCFISSSISFNCDRLKFRGEDSGSVTLIVAPGSGSDTFDFEDSAHIRDFITADGTNTLDRFNMREPQDSIWWAETYYFSNPLYAVYAHSARYGWIDNIEIDFRFNTNLYASNVNFITASLFMYKTGSGQETLNVGRYNYPVSYSINTVTPASDGWTEFKFNDTGKQNINTGSYTDLRVALNGRFIGNAGAFGGNLGPVNFVSSDHPDSSKHPYLLLKYTYSDLLVKKQVSCNIQTNFLTRTIIYPDLRPNPSIPTEVITQPEANLSTTANIRLTGRIPKLVLVSDLSEIILFHSNVDGTWMDPNEERQVSIIDGTRRYTKTNDNSEFTINMHIFKEYNPTLKLLEILMIRKELVYFYPDRYALPIENILHKPAEFYISDIIPYYLMTDSDYDAVLIKLKSTRQTYFGDLPALGYGYRYATRYGVGF